jgi:hypothetical protein
MKPKAIFWLAALAPAATLAAPGSSAWTQPGLFPLRSSRTGTSVAGSALPRENARRHPGIHGT